MARTSQSLWGWVFLAHEKPAWMKAVFKRCCYRVPPQSCFSLLGQPHNELAQGTGLAKICLPVYLSKSYFLTSRLHFHQLNVRVNHSLITVLTSPGSPFFLNIVLIRLTTFPVLSFQKELITLSLVYLYFVPKRCPLTYSANTQVTVLTLKLACMLCWIRQTCIPMGRRGTGRYGSCSYQHTLDIYLPCDPFL